MAKLIPALSEKAKQEIERLENEYFDEIGENPSFSITFEAFQDLFDLEKYPITWEQLFEYISKVKKDTIVIKSNKEVEFHVHFPNGVSCLAEVSNVDNISDLIYVLSFCIRKRDIDIIGDIHGWWEEPQTY